MAITVRGAVDHLYRYLRLEYREIAYQDVTLENPLNDALHSINAALQQMAVTCPLFSAKRPKSALFRPGATLAVAGLTQYGTTCTVASGLAAYMNGCQITLPGDTQVNRIADLTLTGTPTITLQFAYMGSSANGNASVTVDTATLDSDVIRVLEPVRTSAGYKLTPANGREELDGLTLTRDDYGRIAVRPSNDTPVRYFIESAMLSGDSQLVLRMMLMPGPSEAVNVEYQARCSLGRFTSANVYGDSPGYADPATPIPVANEFVESLFLPLAVDRFFAMSILRDTPKPSGVEEQASAAIAMLERMRPQGRKAARIVPVY